MTKLQHIAAKAIITNKAGKVLVMQQSHDHAVQGHGQYHPPGGIVELGETLMQALHREVKEEASIQIEVHDLLSLQEWQATIRGDQCYFVGAFFSCSIANEAAIHTKGKSEVIGFKWIGPEDLKEIKILQPSLTVIEKVFTDQAATKK